MEIGDKVKVVGYGHPIYISSEGRERELYKNFPIIVEDDGLVVFDTAPELVGKEGVIDGVSFSGEQFSIDGIKGKHAWYSKKQLEKID